MDNIQRTDRNPSDLGIMEEVEELTSEEVRDEELTDEELSAIDGGGIGAVGGAAGGAGGSILDNVSHGEPINWRRAGVQGLAGGAIGALAGAIPGAMVGGTVGILGGASLAGED
jgi:hypothetical protein